MLTAEAHALSLQLARCQAGQSLSRRCCMVAGWQVLAPSIRHVLCETLCSCMNTASPTVPADMCQQHQ